MFYGGDNHSDAGGFVAGGGLKTLTSADQISSSPSNTRGGRKYKRRNLPAARTVIKVIGHLRQFFTYAKAKNLIASNFIDDDFREACKEIWKEVSQARTHNSYLPFKSSDLAQIFAPRSYLAFNSQANYFWLPLLGLYSCARLSELAGLCVSDIRIDKPSGVHFLNLIEVDDDTDEERRDLKNVQSIRRVPIASRLIELGFLDYVGHVRAMGALKLFPHVRDNETNARDPGKNGGRRFAAYLDSLEIRSRKLVFHSFRHLGITRLLKDGVPLADSELIAGHAAQEMALAASRTGQSGRGWMSTQVSTYMHKRVADEPESLLLLTLQKHIDKAFDFGLDMPGLRAAADIVREHTIVTVNKGRRIFKSGWHTNAVRHRDAMLERLDPFCQTPADETVA